MARKTPQQKKRDSYLKDRRDTYGENAKSSRRSVRRHKRHVVRANRRAEHQELSDLTTTFDATRAEGAEIHLAGKRPKTWIKTPASPLGQVVQRKLLRRTKLGIIRPAETRTKVKRIKRRTS
ncbi:MAG TPA: hypothetical protein VNX15_03890 [Gemmatimonadales bacterium]|jgi:hypothetical protein|nr:hypothetical protein [Gemmatimonadales bacterium]